MKKIGFPGLGWEFELDSTAFTVFGINIQWYGIIISVGIVLAFLLFYRLATKKEQILPDTVYNITLLVVPIAIIGARITYVATRWDDYKDGGFLNMINIRNGGLAIYGAVIFGLATVLIYNKIKKTSSLAMLDALAPAVMLGQVIGRWGNFVNAEAYGWTADVEKYPWRMWLETVKVDGVTVDSHLVHPTFLYESLWNLIGLVIILAVIYRKKKFNGQIFCAYMGWYGFGRFFIEMIRADSLYIGKLKFSVLVGALCFIGAVVCAFIFSHRSKAEREELEEYESGFTAAKLASQAEGDALDESVYDNSEADGTEEPEAEAGEEGEKVAAEGERDEIALNADGDFEVVTVESHLPDAPTGETAPVETGEADDFVADSEVLNSSCECEELTGDIENAAKNKPEGGPEQ